MFKNKVIFLGFVFLAVIGSILFFPVKMPTGANCLCEHWLNPDVNSDACAHDYADCTCAGTAHLRAQQYIFPYGFAWWLSIAVLSAGVYRIQRKFSARSGQVD